jgi:transcriptional regulator with XRE-family HTH domain
MEMKNEIGIKIREYRSKWGYSQEYLAIKVNNKLGCNIDRKTISNYELGTSSPRASMLKALAYCLFTSTDELLSEIKLKS